LRSFIASKLPNSLTTVSEQFSMWRKILKDQIRDSRLRQRVWQRLSADMLSHANWQIDQAKVNAAQQQAKLNVGHVYLVGAGPGDPQLLTLRAWNLLQAADVIVHDRLVSPDILALARRDAERIYVGKACAAHTLPQEKINQLLVDLAQQGKTVLRLKGGDPFVFGRGGEELLCLRAAGIPVEVVPGITAALGCAASAQIPLTHRGIANRVQFLTGHSAENELPDVDWFSLNARDLTLVFYMGLKNLERVCEQLITHGRAPETPMVIISGGTTASQQVVHSTLAHLSEQSRALPSPCLVVVGEVVKVSAASPATFPMQTTLLPAFT
jgi:uroporphyrin-III C-methyltransferase/precorrin-2 dehydrogenase/sirohydrochlorin ferrochelatase